ncbi:uncharacterized protein QC761_109960 [Podospora bellae-mahoneyi]|uniref:Uncharacterized protein n=1 Tax=Podospora bellae-mahoneyi TaxID=2093777 RepID=A0ABR0FWU9_9PEZI|nr:hypothetical protein QC761_109960 [Podospora bellae-mahoneyi]
MNQNALQKQTIALCSPLPVVSDLGTSPREAEKRLEQLAQL